MDQLAIVILNFNGRQHLETFLPSVLAHAAGFPVYVADNGSADNSVAFLQSRFPEVRLLQFSENGGFSRGYNLALRQIEATYYVLLNSDVEVTPGWIAPVLALLEKDKNIAACQPKIRSFAHRPAFEYAGAGGGFVDWLGYPFCRGRLFTTLETDTGQYDDEIPVFWASGACMFVRAAVYHELGGLDEDFFAHMEEIDLCWRMHSAGYSVFYCGKSTVYHLGGGTLPKNHPHKTFLNFRNGLLLLYKNLPARRLLPVLFMRMVLDGLAGLKFLFSDSVHDFLAVLNAHLNFYWYLRRWHKNRQQTQQRRKPGNSVTLFPKSIVKAYFADKKKTFPELLR